MSMYSAQKQNIHNLSCWRLHSPDMRTRTGKWIVLNVL